MSEIIQAQQTQIVHGYSSSQLPKTYQGALFDPNWKLAMEEEYGAPIANQTWDLVPLPPRANIVLGKWFYRHKLNAYGSLARYKAHWVVHDFSQQQGLDCDERFSPIIKHMTICMVLSLVISLAHLPIGHQKCILTWQYQ